MPGLGCLSTNRTAENATRAIQTKFTEPNEDVCDVVMQLSSYTK